MVYTALKHKLRGVVLKAERCDHQGEEEQLRTKVLQLLRVVHIPYGGSNWEPLTTMHKSQYTDGGTPHSATGS